MKFCIMHFASSFLRILFSKKLLQEFVYEVLLILSRTVLTTLQRIQCSTKGYTALLHGTNTFFQKIKSYGRWSAEKLTVKFYLVPGVRNRKFYLVPGVRNGKIYLVPDDSYETFYLTVKGLTRKAHTSDLLWAICLLLP